MNSPRSILDKAFVYRNSASTDVAATFARERERLAKEKAEQEQIEAEQKRVLRQLRKR